MSRYSEYVKTENIRNARKGKGITVEEITSKMGLASRVSYYNLETGIVEPRISQMVTLSKILEEPVSNFFAL